MLQKGFPSYTADVEPEPRQLLPPPEKRAPDPEPIPEELIPPSITTLPVPIIRLEPDLTPVRLPRRSLARILLENRGGVIYAAGVERSTV